MNIALEGEDRPIWDYSNFTEVIINRPAGAVWPFLLRPKADVWSRTVYTAAGGEPGQVGETYAMEYKGGQLLFEAIAVKPPKRLVLKILHKQSANSVSKLAGYDLITLSEADGRTTLVLQQVLALAVEPYSEEHDLFLAEIFQDLKRMVEDSTPDRERT